VGTEIERKFLVADDSWRAEAGPGAVMAQGYLCTGPPVAARVRVTGDVAHLNLKKATLDIKRAEYEYPIPVADAMEILHDLCGGHIIEKTRYEVEHEGLVWEVDVFAGLNEGLIVAEVELDSEDQHVPRPPWVGEEVSSDARYFNSHLSVQPFSEW
jgi:adenylate cyclase